MTDAQCARNIVESMQRFQAAGQSKVLVFYGIAEESAIGKLVAEMMGKGEAKDEDKANQ